MEYTKEDYKREMNAYKTLKTQAKFTDYVQGYFDAMEKVENLILFGVSRSIGSDTKEVLLRLTQDQKDKHYDACSLCRYSHNEPNSYQCVKCSENNDLDQYYG